MSALDDKDMFVTKRSGKKESVSFDKILKRIKKIGTEVGIKTNYTTLAMKVIEQLFDGISTTQIDELSASQCASMASIHPDYNVLAGRLIISNHHKNTSPSFVSVVKQLYKNKDKHGKPYSLISEQFYQNIIANSEFLENLIDYSRDYFIDYFGFKTLDKSYLLRLNQKTVERPQHMWMRVAVAIHGTNNEKIEETYFYLSNKYMTHATPTLFNAGTNHQQLSSCFLLAMESDSIEGIFNTLTDCALISKWAGGIGLHIHNVRASGSRINGTSGLSNGIVPMLRVFNNTAKYVDQCLDPTTIIYTKRGAIQIKEIIIGDKVITDDGNFYKIGKILDNEYNGDLYVLNLKDSLDSLKLTDMHPLWTIQYDSFRRPNFDEIINMLDRKLITPDFVEVKNININDLIGFPIPKYVKDLYQYTIDDCRFYGIMLGSGTISDKDSLAYIILNRKTNKETIEFVKTYLQKLNIQIWYTFSETAFDDPAFSSVLFEPNFDQYVKLTWSRTNLFKFTYEMLYNNKELFVVSNMLHLPKLKEKIVMSNMLHLPKPKILHLIKGILEAHGKVKNDQLVLESTSRNIIESIRYMLLRLGILTSGNICSLIIPKTQIICDLFKSEYIQPSTQFTFFEYNNYLFSIVISNNLVQNYSGRVIDIEVDNNDHHNFLTHHGLVKNGGGKRNGSFAIYLEPWHADIEIFLQMRKNHGDEELKARDLFYALWIPDLFMERVKANGKWTLMCPDECRGLSDVYGDEFVTLYTKYEESGKGRCTINARDLWYKILDAQMETGTPYLLYKDNCNKKSNQKNLGTIKSSNLCCEIIQYSDENETAVCNLASIALPAFVDSSVEPPIFDFEKLHKVASVAIHNLNRVIDINFYPTEKARNSNLKHRPVGLGISGFSDVFMMMNLSFTSDEAKELNRQIFETIYHGALEESCNISITDGPYTTFAGSPASQGILQFDMWNVDPTSKRYDWDAMKARIKEHGIRNSLLVAPMPTASTSQILGYNECIEPITSNIYSRRTMAGEFILANKYLMNDLIKLNLWNEKIKDNIIANNGSIQQIDIIPQDIREKYRTVWELPMKALIDMAVDRGAYICQSQSLNLWVEDPTYSILTSMHFYSWAKGLKTGIYYLRRRAKHSAQQFTIVPKKAENNIEDDDVCLNCSA